MKKSLLAVSVLALASGSSAWGQQQGNTDRFERQLQQIYRETRLRANPSVPAGQRALLDYGGFLSFSYFWLDDSSNKSHGLREYDLIGYARLNIDNAHEFFIRARTAYRDFNQGESFDGEGDETISPRIEQAYYRFDLARYLSATQGKNIENNLTIQAGRQFVYWANGLVLAQTLDGMIVDFTVGNVTLEAIGGQTWGRTIDFDSSRPQFDDSTYRGFYGGMLSARVGKHRPYVYGLVQQDYNSSGPFDVNTVPTNFDYNSWYVGGGINGSLTDRLLYGFEIVYEGGSGLSNSFNPSTLAPIAQEENSIQAGAMDFRLDYLFPDSRHTRISLEAVLATGDSDRLNSSNTFGGNNHGADTSYNALGLINTGLAFGPTLSNLAVLRLGASTFPFANTTNFRRLQVGTDLLFFSKFCSNAPIDEPTTDDFYLGFEPDFFMNWQITSDITLALRYGIFFPGIAIESDQPRNFFYMGLTFAF